jgi:hypothetical protein
MTGGFAWVFLGGGLFGLAAARFRWYESDFWQRMDLFDFHSVLDRGWIAGGKRRFYYTTGALFTVVGVVLLGLALLQ